MRPESAFFRGGGSMGAAMRSHDWSASPIGIPDTWPTALHNALNLMLNSPESMYLVWGPGLTFFFNDAYRPILGPRLDGALGQSLPVLWADAWDTVQLAMDDALAGKASRFEDIFIGMARYGEPEETWWSFSYSPVYDEATVGGVFCITNETTERMRATASLRENERRLDALLRSSSEVRYRLNADWSELYQLSGGDFIPDVASVNRNWVNDYMPPSDRAVVRAEFERAIRTKSTYSLEHRVNRVDGSVGWAYSRAVPLFDDEGNVTEWYGAASDITAKRQAEIALHELNETLEQQVVERSAELDRVWKNAQDLQVVIDIEGVYRAVSPAATRMLGWAPEEMIGKSLFAFTDPVGHQESRDALQRAAKIPLPPHRNCYRHKDGSQRWIAWVTTPEDGLIYCYGRDVTVEVEQAHNLVR